jgi:ATP-dependent Clp protease ATP-binding subunit ClpA
MTNSPHATTAYHPWTTFAAAREEARSRGDRRVGTDHLLLGLLRDPEIETVMHVTLESAREALYSLDRSALAAIGVIAEFEAPARADRAMPKRPSAKELWKVRDRLRLTPAAKAVLQEAARPMRRRQQITAQQVLLALMENREPDPAACLLDALGVDVVAVRARLDGPSTE